MLTQRMSLSDPFQPLHPGGGGDRRWIYWACIKVWAEGRVIRALTGKQREEHRHLRWTVRTYMQFRVRYSIPATVEVDISKHRVKQEEGMLTSSLAHSGAIVDNLRHGVAVSSRRIARRSWGEWVRTRAATSSSIVE